jgi:predicted membrane protein
MKKVKIAFWVIVFGFLGLIIFQNQDFFLAKQSLSVNLYFTSYTSPEVENALFFLVFFFAGLLITYIFSLFSQYKAGKTIKALNATIKSNGEELSKLQSEVAALKQPSAPPAEPPPAAQPPVADETIITNADNAASMEETAEATAEKSN